MNKVTASVHGNRKLIASVYGVGWMAIAGKYISDEVAELKKTEKPTFDDYSHASFFGVFKGYVPATIWPITAIAYVSSKFG